MTTTLSPARIVEIHSQMTEIINRSKWDALYPEDALVTLAEELVKVIPDHTDDAELLVAISDIAFKVVQYNRHLDCCVLYVDVAEAIKATTAFEAGLKLQIKVFDVQRKMVELGRETAPVLSKKAMKALRSFVSSSYSDMRRIATLYYCDTKTNPVENVTNLTDELYADTDWLAQFQTNLVDIIVAGPAVYSCFVKENGTMTSNDINTRFFNQFVEGDVGTQKPGAPVVYIQHSISMLKKLATTTPMSKAQLEDLPKKEREAKEKYIDQFHLAGQRAIVRTAELSQKTISRACDAGVDGDDALRAMYTIEALQDAMSVVSNSKLLGQVEKLTPALNDLMEKVEAAV